ncbi:MAG: GldG family protein [Oscillospiraceae bacterium]|nr:GldG family protein [Oscillospiraceae bacterium]
MENERDLQETSAEETAAEEMTAAPVSDPDPEKPKKKVNIARRKRLKYGGLATAITCVVVAIVVLVNVLVSRLTERFPLKLDLTPDGMYEISDESIDYLKTLDQDVNFTVLMAESSFQTGGTNMKMISELLEKYTQYSRNITVSYVDPNTNPDVINQFQANYSGTLSSGDIVVSNAADPTKLRVVNVGDLFSYDQQKYMLYRYYGQGTLEDCITGFSGEQNLTAALMYVTDADPIHVAVLAKANEKPLYNQQAHVYALAMLEQTLTKNGYDVQEIDLYKDAIDPEKYEMIVLPAPVNDLTATAVDSISAFLFNDGNYDRNMLYIADFTQGETPNLDELLSTWGISVTRKLALEGDPDAAQQVALAIGNAAVPVASITDTDYSAGLSNDALPIVAPLCRPIELLWDSKTSGITSALLQTSDTVYLNDMGADTESADKSAAGAQTVAAVTKRRTNIDNITHQSSIMVLGSMMLSDANVMQDASYNNAQYLVSAVNTMTGKGSRLIISEKSLTNETLSLSTGEMRGSMVCVFLIPAAVFAAGVAVILRRRNK